MRSSIQILLLRLHVQCADKMPIALPIVASIRTCKYTYSRPKCSFVYCGLMLCLDCCGFITLLDYSKTTTRIIYRFEIYWTPTIKYSLAANYI